MLLEPRGCGHQWRKLMTVRLDAIIAEIARNIDLNLLMQYPDFAELPRFHRMHFIVRSLASCDIARGEKYGGRKVRRWRPSRRLEGNLGVKGHGIPDEIERIEAPIAISTLVDELSDLLKENGEAIDEVTHYVLRRQKRYSKILVSK
jgi:hypothetical protein